MLYSAEWRTVEEIVSSIRFPLDIKEIKPVNPKGNQPWILIGKTDAEVPNTLPTWCKELTH